MLAKALSPGSLNDREGEQLSPNVRIVTPNADDLPGLLEL